MTKIYPVIHRLYDKDALLFEIQAILDISVLMSCENIMLSSELIMTKKGIPQGQKATRT